MTKESNSHTKDCKLVGVMVPQPIAEYLTLYALLKGKTKSNIVRTMIHDSYLTFRKELSQKQLISGLTKQYQKEWDKIKKDKKISPLLLLLLSAEFLGFKADIFARLEYKSLPETTIEQIISKIKM
jgi:hypothetical protein